MSLEVTVYTKDNCGQCIDTKRSLDSFKIPHRIEHVADNDVEKIEDLRKISDDMGIELSMPYVKVVEIETGETEQWFGHRVDLIVENIIRKRRKTRA